MKLAATGATSFVKAKSEDSILDGEVAAASQERRSEQDSEEGEEEGKGEDSDEPETSEERPKGKRKAKRNTEEKKKYLRRDMFKVFDGPALLAIGAYVFYSFIAFSFADERDDNTITGMLLQHHIASLVEAHKPNGWEDEMEREMERAGGDGVSPRGGRRRRKTGNVQAEFMELRREEEEESEEEAEDDKAVEAGIGELNTKELEEGDGGQLSSEDTDPDDLNSDKEDSI